MRITFFNNSHVTFKQYLDGVGLNYRELKATQDEVGDTCTTIEIEQTGDIAGIANVLVVWLNTRKSRRIMFTLADKRVFHLAGYSVKQVGDLLPLVQHGMAIDTRTDGDEQGNSS
jgi:hypothetical protein